MLHIKIQPDEYFPASETHVRVFVIFPFSFHLKVLYIENPGREGPFKWI